jgi:hypothetical protein
MSFCITSARIQQQQLPICYNSSYNLLPPPPMLLGERQPEAGFLVRVHPESCLILSRAQIRALLCSSKSKFIPA